MKKLKTAVSVLVALLVLVSCAAQDSQTDDEGTTSDAEEIVNIDETVTDDDADDEIELDEDVFMEESELPVSMELLTNEVEAVTNGYAALSTSLMPEASGTSVEKKTKATIDYSNTKDGYVMVKFTAESDKRLKATVTGPSAVVYQYNITQGEWATLPLSDGNGSYTIKVLENVKDSSYAVVVSKVINVELEDEFAPFLRPNQYVNYENAEKTLELADSLCKDLTDTFDKVEAVYHYVVTNITYDYDKASSVKSGYLPVLDDVLKEKKGICFDYGSLMAGMLRSQGVPVKLVIGYAGETYHAWVNVWTEETGWIDGAIYFDGTTWQRMDPTFASTGGNSKAILEYITNGKNYNPKYIY